MPEMVQDCNDAIEVIDFTVIETIRDKRTQDRYFNSGASHVQWPNSKHNIYRGRPIAEAMDLWPYIKGIGAISGHPSQIKAIAINHNLNQDQVKAFVYKAFARLAGAVQAVAYTNGHMLRWGGDWDNDGNMLDQNFHDLPHFEFKGDL